MHGQMSKRPRNHRLALLHAIPDAIDACALTKSSPLHPEVCHVPHAHAEHFVLEALLTMGMNMEVADSVGAFPVPLPGSSYATRVVSGWANSD